MFDMLRDEIHQLKSENSELAKCLEFTQVELLEIRKEVKEQISILNQKKITDDNGSELCESMRNLEDYSWRKNLIVEGLEEKKEENKEIFQVTVQKIIREKLRMEPSIEEIHRLDKSTNSKPRPVIVKMSSYKERKTALKQRRG